MKDRHAEEGCFGPKAGWGTYAPNGDDWLVIEEHLVEEPA